MDVTQRVTELIEPSVEALGYEIVRVAVKGGKYAILQIMADRKDGAPMRVEDCEAISQTVSALMDVEDPIKSAYNLEVSSPGIDRPLTRLSDFERWAGHEAKVDLKAPLNGRRRWAGVLRGANGDQIRLELEDGTVHELPFPEVQNAKLVLTDALIKLAQQQQQGV